MINNNMIEGILIALFIFVVLFIMEWAGILYEPREKSGWENKKRNKK